MSAAIERRPPLVDGIGVPARVAFLDGPASEGRPKNGGDRLSLNRAPTFLRAVIESTGTVDALDLPEDAPTEEEAVAVYELTIAYHARGATRAESGWFADYRHRGDVDGERLRERAAWVAWCEGEAATRKKAA